jgi:hypothetical protein
MKAVQSTVFVTTNGSKFADVGQFVVAQGQELVMLHLGHGSGYHQFSSFNITSRIPDPYAALQEVKSLVS